MPDPPSPATGSSPTGTGSGSGAGPGAGSGIGSVEVTVRNMDTNLYWDGTMWVEGPKPAPASGTSNWAVPFAPEEGGSYEVQARAVDRAGNAQEVASVAVMSYSTGSDTHRGRCGSTGVDLLWPLALLWWARRRRASAA